MPYKQPDKHNHNCRWGRPGQPFRIQCDGMLMAGIQFTAGEHEFQLFHQQRKGLVRMVCIRVAEPASDTRREACEQHGVSQGYLSGALVRIQHLSQTVNNLLPYYVSGLAMNHEEEGDRSVKRGGDWRV